MCIGSLTIVLYSASAREGSRIVSVWTPGVHAITSCGEGVRKRERETDRQTDRHTHTHTHTHTDRERETEKETEAGAERDRGHTQR